MYMEIARRVFNNPSFFYAMKVKLIVDKYVKALPVVLVRQKSSGFILSQDAAIMIKQRMRKGKELDIRTKYFKDIDLEFRLSTDCKKVVKKCNFVKEFTQKVKAEIDKHEHLKRYYYEENISPRNHK